MPDLDIVQELGQSIQVAFDLLKEAQKAFDKSDAIRGGIFTAASQALLETVLKKTNFLGPLQMGLLPNGMGLSAIKAAQKDVANMIDDFLKLHKEKHATGKISN